jgi:putative aldouronate transport system permease protein
MRKISVSNILINFFFILYSACGVLPLLLVLSVSFTDEKSILTHGYGIIPAKMSFFAYSYIIKYVDLIRPYILTIIVTLIGTLLSTLIVALFAYPLSRNEFKYRRFFSFFIFFTMIFSGGFVPWYIVCVQLLHINNSIFGLIVPYLINGWYVIILRTFFQTNVPNAIIDSARVDGSSELGTFFKIVLPISKPGLATVALFTTLAYWNDWWLPFILITDPKLFNVQYTILRVLNQISFLRQNYMVAENTRVIELPGESARMAMCIVAIGPIVFAYPFFQKYFIKGLTVGSVKG